MAAADAKAMDNQEKPGFTDRLRAHAPEIVTNNAPRIVAGLKILGCSAMFFSKNRVFSAAGAGFISAFSIIALFGKKKTEEEKEKLRQEAATKDNEKPKGYLADYFNKLTHPSKYPIEAGTGIAMASSAVWTASSMLGKGGFSPGRMVAGTLSFASDANIVFTREQIGEPEANPYKEGSVQYYLTEMKHRPVLLSSMFNIGSDIASIVGGGHEFGKGKEPNLLVAGGFLLAANTFQAIFVDKNDYNIEHKGSEKKPDTAMTPAIVESSAQSVKV